MNSTNEEIIDAQKNLNELLKVTQLITLQIHLWVYIQNYKIQSQKDTPIPRFIVALLTIAKSAINPSVYQ